MNKIIFLEGPAFSGKTTFLRQAPEDIVRLPEASEFLGGDAYFPDAPIDAKTMAYCSYFFAVMENMRFEGIGNDKQNSLVLVDRFTPLSSMIFYALRHANGDISESDYRLGVRLSAAIFNQTIQLPTGYSKFIRFDISSSEILSRRLPRGTRNGELASWRAFEFYSNWYERVLPVPTERIVDGVYDGDLLDGPWTKIQVLLSRIMNTNTYGILAELEAVSDKELEQYLSQSTKRTIEARVKELVRMRGVV